jgi:multiple sugar transport system permease protein
MKNKQSMLAPDMRTRRTRKGSMERSQRFWGWIFIMPLSLGLTIWVAFPLGISLVASTLQWDMISPARFVGLGNFIRMFTTDPLFLQSVVVTLKYTLLAVPLQLLIAFGLALLLTSKVRAIGVYRTIFYIPSLIPVVVSSAMWLWLFDQSFGLLNIILESLGLPAQEWIFSTRQVIPSLVFMNLWTVGNVVIIFLAGLQDIPKQLREAVSIDGGNAWHELRHVIIPFMSPVIFYNLVIGLINSFQTFTQPYIMTHGGPSNASLTYLLDIYQQAFQFNKMGYACAMAWAFIVVTILLSAVLFKGSGRWVYYEGGGK